MNSNKLKGVIIYLVIIFLLIFGLVSVLNIASNSSRTTVTYSGVISEFDDLNVAQYQLDLGSGALTYKLKGEAASAPAHQYTVPNVSIFINDINSGYTSDGKAANYRLRYNEANPDSPLVEDYIPISDNTFLTSVLPAASRRDDHFYGHRNASEHRRRKDVQLLQGERAPEHRKEGHI